MTAEAANCLLKTLEEPPENSLIILVTAKPSLLFKTVISRCRLIKFYPLQRQSLADILVNDYGLTQHPARFLAFFSEGRMGSAIALKDSEIFQEKNEIIDAFFASPPARGSRLLGTDRVSLRHHCNILATWFRDIYLCKAQVPDSEFIHCDRSADVARAAAGYSFAALDKIVQSISEALLHIDQNINPRLVVANLRAVLS
jgi:DNA polymerase-3 subunit delta'